MQVAESSSYANSLAINNNQLGGYDAQVSSDALVLNNLGNNNSEDKVSLDFTDLYKGLSITAQQIVDKLNGLLKDHLPSGLQSLKPEEVTPEATSDNVVKGVTALFDAFAKQNSNLSAEELIAKFMEEAKKGVEQGYSDAKAILGDLGALEIDGVESDISKTKELILQKLDKFGDLKLEELTGKSKVTNQTEAIAKSALLTQGGVSYLNIAA